MGLFLRKGSVQLKLEDARMLLFERILALTLAPSRSCLTFSRQIYYYVNLVEVIDLFLYIASLARQMCEI